MIEDTPFGRLFFGLRSRQRSYQAVFDRRDSAAKAVLGDLAKFCRLFATTHEQGQSRDDGLVLEGRRQVLLRIIEHLELPPEQLFAIFSGMAEPERAALFDNARPSPIAEGT